MRIVAISDTHERFHPQEDLPSADVLIHCGDFSNQGTDHAIRTFGDWLCYHSHKYQKIIVVAGNHDIGLESKPAQSQELLRFYGPPNLIYLQDQSIEIDGYKIYGSPWQPRFGDWAFNIDRGEKLAAKWAKIPLDTTILITHGPPRNILDPGRSEKNVGCDDLAARVKIVKPRIHVFGHCHDGYGRYREAIDSPTLYINAASCDEMHNLVNKPQIISL